MSEALARIRPDSALKRVSAARPARRGVVVTVARWASALPARAYVAAVLSALLFGIGFNALLLQRERHPAPLFATPRSPEPRPAAPAPPAAPPREAASDISSPASPPPRPSAASAPSARATDPINDLLRGESASTEAHLVLAAQNALIKLGYKVKADGSDDAATRQALRAFERSHGLPPGAEITPQLVRQLTAAARSAAR